MNAIFKTKDRLLVTGSDSDERLLVKEFVNAARDKDFKVEALVDINGDETGISIELIDKVVEEVEPEVSEPTPSE